jgi:hypothetical protein
MAIASCETISDTEFKKLQDKKAKTKTERHQERKASLNERYGVDVTPELVGKDDDNWYPKLRLHYFLTLGREHLVSRDSSRAKLQIEVGENAIWKPDFNRGQLLPVVLILEKLNIGYFLQPGIMFRGSDVELQQLKALAVKHRYFIRDYLGVSVSEGMSAIAIVQNLLSKLGLKLTYVGRIGSRDKRERVYQFVEPKDERDFVFAGWQNRVVTVVAEASGSVVGVHQ